MANNSHDGASAAAATAKSRLEKETDAARNEFRSTAEGLRREAGNVAAEAKERATEGATRGKDAIAAGMTDVAAAVRKASEELSGRDQTMVAGFAREIAGGLEEASASVQAKSLSDLSRAVTHFARQQPTAFLLGATMAGFALGRFIKASDDREPGHPPANPGGNRDR
jgi:hypothetical protein